MPEITSRDRINRKLQEFENLIEGAIVAAETIIRQKETVSDLMNTMQEEFEESTAIIDHLQKIQKEWEELRNEVAESQANADLSIQILHEKYDQICLELERDFKEKTEELYKINRNFLEEHSQLVDQSRAHAYGTAQAIESANTSVNSAEELLENVKSRLCSEIDSRMNKNELLLSNSLARSENQWNEKVCNIEIRITNELDQFKKENDESLKKHQKGIDGSITEFLSKQNILIQNLSQQIDGFSRQMQTFSIAQQDASKKMQFLENSLDQISIDEGTIKTIENEMKVLATRLEQAISRLQGIRFVGSSFKNL